MTAVAINFYESFSWPSQVQTFSDKVLRNTVAGLLSSKLFNQIACTVVVLFIQIACTAVVLFIQIACTAVVLFIQTACIVVFCLFTLPVWWCFVYSDCLYSCVFDYSDCLYGGGGVAALPVAGGVLPDAV